MFHIKICGITRLEDGLAAAEAGADAVGFNFCRSSPRYVEPVNAEAIAVRLPSSLLRVGVFVNATADEICQVRDAAWLDGVQLHGDEPPDLIAELPQDVLVVRAFRMREAGLAPLAEYVAATKANGRVPDAVLIDAFSPSAHGGTGQTVDWQRVRTERSMLGEMPLILAGGLNPRNVADAIGLAQPDGVDTASGVEISPGIKDSSLIRGFVIAAREALS
jgi:phosphoribosylanthranilate isomerase